MKEQTLSRIERCKIIAVIRSVKGERLVPMAQALQSGGIDCIEICFDPCGAQSEQDIAAQISMLTEHFGDALCVGAGTVSSVGQVSAASDAGAQFIVSPGTLPQVIAAAGERGLVSVPGAFTPTEILTAHQLGADIVKLFPASFVGTEYLDQLRKPLGNIRLMANGGISVWNMRAFLDAGCAAVGIGKNLTGEVYKPVCDYGVLAETAAAYRAIADNDRRPVHRDLR
ncbi:MAG: bifunctional 4-hydroxy-2-oxoglutarate aldolase/2-dehydro-3-deoxy-phosphogluconate aldolase [Oscillospiraceae bacterium]|nr:bifunctional 4-hydroxy-2-oxoglutarate aldolase/2-dehydro-3-deoxy-phosphogluconate aldolase [Oscillospiraceae bacterium]